MIGEQIEAKMVVENEENPQIFAIQGFPCLLNEIKSVCFLESILSSSLSTSVELLEINFQIIFFDIR